jgi:hypothetical protein
MKIKCILIAITLLASTSLASAQAAMGGCTPPANCSVNILPAPGSAEAAKLRALEIQRLKRLGLIRQQNQQAAIEAWRRNHVRTVTSKLVCDQHWQLQGYHGCHFITVPVYPPNH